MNRTSTPPQNGALWNIMRKFEARGALPKRRLTHIDLEQAVRWGGLSH
jgi:hypothetical protein